MILRYEQIYCNKRSKFCTVVSLLLSCRLVIFVLQPYINPSKPLCRNEI